MNPVTALAVSVLLGGVFGAGLLLVLAAFPRWRRPALVARLAPHLRDIFDDAPSSHVWGSAMPVPTTLRWETLVQSFAGLMGASGETVALRLAQSGIERTVASFRARQLAWGLVGAGAGAIGTIMLAVLGRMSVPAALLPLLAGAGAALAFDALLTMRAKARVSRLADEMPTVLEFFALCLSAGEGPLDALRRVAKAGSGELSHELRSVVLAVSTGSGLAEALSAAAQRLQIPSFSRVVDQIVAALERGAPLASVLQAQASDAREDTKRALIESAGRKEILMLLPLVFLILPLSVLFAVFPGIFILRLGIG